MADDIEATITSTLNEQFGNDWNTDSSGGADDIVEVGSPEDTGGDDGSDTDTDDDTPATGDNTETGTEEGGVEEDPNTQTQEPAEEDDADDTDKELEALGIKRPQKGQRENKLPYTRMKKIFTNAKKKWDEGVQTTIKGHTDKIASYEQTMGRYRATDQLIATDPDRFMKVLAHLNPAYQKFIDGAAGKSTAETFTDSNDPRPEPDFTYQDGSKGFTPEGFAKREAWNQRQAVREAVALAKKEWEKDFGPIRQEREDARKFREDEDRRRASVQDQISRTRKVWGDEVLTQHKDEILKKLREDTTLTFGDAVAAVMYPKLSASRDTIRTQVSDELRQRPGAVTKTGGQGTTRQTRKSDADMSTEDVIVEALREQGLVR